MRAFALATFAALLAVPDVALGQSCSTKCGRSWGDPHIVTFDDLKYDCQGEGEFILAKSLDSDLMVQARQVIGGGHSLGGSGYPVMVNRAFVFNTGEAGVPTIQVTVPDHDSQCPMTFYVNGVEHDIPTQGTTSSTVFYSTSGSTRIFRYPRGEGLDDFRIEVSVKYSSKNGCNMAIQVCLPCDIQEQNIVGLLGSAPDGDTSNDWMTNDPTPSLVTVPTQKWELLFKPAYDYCVPNWCIYDESDSIFTYTDKTFDDYHVCKDPDEYDDGGLFELMFPTPNPDSVTGKCFNGHFYQLYPESKNFLDAWDVAQSRTKFGQQGYIATITTAEENDFIKTLTTSYAWIGVNDMNEEGTFEWYNGDAVYTYEATEAFWMPGEPNDYRGGEDCTEINFGNNKEWNDQSCSQARMAIFEYDSCGPTTEEVEALKDKVPGDGDDICWECLMDGLEGDEDDIQNSVEVVEELDEVIRFAPPPNIEVGADPPAVITPGMCECLDNFLSTASGDYQIANLYYEACGGVDVQQRRVETGTTGAYRNDAVIIQFLTTTLEVHGSDYYVNGMAASLPSSIDGYPVSLATKTGKEEITVDCGDASLVITAPTSTVYTHTSIVQK